MAAASVRLVRHHTRTEYGPEVTSSLVLFRLISESSYGSLLSISLIFSPTDVLFFIQESCNALMSLLGLQMSMGGSDHLLSGSSHTRLHLKIAIEISTNKLPTLAPPPGVAGSGRARALNIQVQPFTCKRLGCCASYIFNAWRRRLHSLSAAVS
ncbi:hypothetical protein EVAR_12783_1 [Eumeta japonica]|uniref:Uncharacterized protein n=1 Tax=Eumeta variegata TaxID=151549 RepID=A0A4C1UAN4_EUMVA|nr:hypothetical protein EVAR_12783_1 [Eumeta japonica]